MGPLWKIKAVSGSLFYVNAETREDAFRIAFRKLTGEIHDIQKHHGWAIVKSVEIADFSNSESTASALYNRD